MSKGEIPVGYIVAIVLGVIVIVLLGYLFFVQSGNFTGTISEQTCIGKLLSYCNFWSVCNYGPECQPGGAGADFFSEKNSKDCEPLKSKLITESTQDKECRKRLTQSQ
ncbi:MAG: hypothetical protein HY361_03695 [Candidatus Aenigmarchaeota archaeon]|nr:hypothetical protein [Candidatus Aenigmarchaeota archaeon]